MNISSALVIPDPDCVQGVVAALGEVNGVEVAAVSPEGKIIITIETEGDRDTVARFEQINLLDGVMSVAMVYHQQESEPEAEITLAA